jgi:hypothetical protein
VTEQQILDTFKELEELGKIKDELWAELLKEEEL